ncbi:hypothetical protein NVP2095A_26 [Vibrio phage 2.095.A._10N.286.46.E10]|nr:hypothetical protein NVP2095A_26 [Vibrio phage 2.095.A._10N.286.46.E10]AUS02184.1 hypothetical protein NVP2095B_26 [Vibrio phage 2.095.B._10N.286.46.E10]
MAKQFNQSGVSDKLEFGKDGNELDMSNGHASFVDKDGNAIEVRGKDATNAASFATKGQLDAATGSDTGTVWIEYTTEPSLTNFSDNTAKLFDLTTGAADLKADHSTIPSNTSWNGSDARTYIIDTTNGLITPNALDKQSHTISVEFEYDNWGSSTNTGVSGYMSLIEYNGSSEHLEIRKFIKKSNNDNQTGTFTVDFHTNVTNQVNGSGKGWRLYVTSNEADSNATFKLKTIRLKAG